MFKSYPSIEAIFPGQIISGGNGRGVKWVLAFAIAPELAENLLAAEGNDLVARTAGIKMLGQLIFRAFFQVADSAQRGERPRQKGRVRHRVAQAALKERCEPGKCVFKTIGPIHADPAGAEPLRDAARWRVSRNCAGVIEFRVGRLQGETQIGVADSAVGGACVRRGGGSVCGCSTWNIG